MYDIMYRTGVHDPRGLDWKVENDYSESITRPDTWGEPLKIYKGNKSDDLFELGSAFGINMPAGPALIKTGMKVKKAPYRKPEAVRELERMANEEARQKHPTCPHLAPRTFRDDGANNLTKCITTYLRLKGAFVSRLNNGGIYDYRLKKYRPGTNRRGLPDVIATYEGKSIFVEVKHGRDRMSEHQERIRQEQEQSGGLWFTAHNFTEFKIWFDNIK